MNDVDHISISGSKLKNVIERIERLEDEKETVQDSIKEVYQEAGGQGFDIRTLKKVVKLRKMDSEKLEEQEYLLNLYKNALGM